jgi:hypothetical protein
MSRPWSRSVWIAKPPHQPWDEDEDHHDDEARRGDGGRGEQDNCGEQPYHAKDHKRAPVLGPVDAPLGADQEFERPFHDRATYESIGEPASGNVSPETNSGSRQTKRLNRSEP